MRTPWELAVHIGGGLHRALFDKPCLHPATSDMSRPPSCTVCGASVEDCGFTEYANTYLDSQPTSVRRLTGIITRRER